MASLWKHPKSKYWFACFTDRTGKRRKVSTKTTDRRKALQIAVDLERAFRDLKAAEQFESLIRQAKDNAMGVKSATLSADAYLTQWLARKKSSRVAEGSMKVYTLCAERLRQSLGPGAKKPVTTITKKQLEDFRDWLTDELGLSAKSVQTQCRVMRMIFKCVREDYGGESPAEFVRPPAADREAKRKPAFTLEQLRRMAGSMVGEMKTLTLLGIYTGARLGDLHLLKWESVDLAAGVISFRTQKTRRMMRIPIAPPLLRHVQGLERVGDYVVPGLAAKATNSVGIEFVRDLRRHGIRTDMDRGGLSFHSLRHGLVSMLKAAGAPVSVAMEFAGHDSQQMSQHYTTVSDEAMRQAAAGLPDLE